MLEGTELISEHTLLGASFSWASVLLTTAQMLALMGSSGSQSPKYISGQNAQVWGSGEERGVTGTSRPRSRGADRGARKARPVTAVGASTSESSRLFKGRT